YQSPGQQVLSGFQHYQRGVGELQRAAHRPRQQLCKCRRLPKSLSGGDKLHLERRPAYHLLWIQRRLWSAKRTQSRKPGGHLYLPELRELLDRKYWRKKRRRTVFERRDQPLLSRKTDRPLCSGQFQTEIQFDHNRRSSLGLGWPAFGEEWSSHQFLPEELLLRS